MYKTFLDDDFEISGNREIGAKKALSAFSESTKYELVNPYSFTIFSLLSKRKNNSLELIKIEPDYTDEQLIIPQNMNQVYYRRENGNKGAFPIQKFRDWGVNDTQIKEICERGFFLQYLNEKGKRMTLIPSQAFLATLCRQLGCGKLSDGINPFRDLYLASLMRDAEPFKLVYRTNGSVCKAFGCFSKNFTQTPQMIAFDFKEGLSKFGPVLIRAWRLNHFLTAIDFSFAEESVRIGKMRITPGVRLTMSDVGDASYSLQNALYINGGLVLFDKSVSKRHSGTLEVKEMIEEYEINYRHMKEVLKSLSSMQNVPIENLRKTVRNLLKYVGFGNLYGVRNASKFKEVHVNELSTQPATLLDAILIVIKIPGMIRNNCTALLYDRVAAGIGKILENDITGKIEL